VYTERGPAAAERARARLAAACRVPHAQPSWLAHRRAPPPRPADLARVPASERSTFQYGVVNGANTGTLLNNGHTVQLTIPAGFAPANASVVVVGARPPATP
jgi:hypothetical protein